MLAQNLPTPDGFHFGGARHHIKTGNLAVADRCLGQATRCRLGIETGTRAFAPALQTDMPNCATLAVSANY